MRRLRPASAAGWTLIEMMVVVALITVLVGIAAAQYRNGVIRAQEAVLKEDLFRMRDAIDQYYSDKQQYPEALEALVSEGYLRTLPQDPFTSSVDTWQTVQAEADARNPSAPPGVYDVKSGSDRMALDGTAYSEW